MSIGRAGYGGMTRLVLAVLTIVACGGAGPDATTGAVPERREQAVRSEGPASYVLVIVGLGGDHENADRFHRWATSIVDAATQRYGLPGAHVVYLGEDPARDSTRIAGRSTRETIETTVHALAGRARPGDRVFVILIGHGASAAPGAARFNIPGPDLTATEFARLLDRFAAQQVVFVNTASASGGFVAALSGRNRTIIAATRTDGERNQTRFGEHFAEALASDEADLDKDGRVSMLEAFVFAKQRVADSYARDGQLLTEHAVLDDNGDGTGGVAPGQPGEDGAQARTLFLTAGGVGVGTDGADSDPELRALVAQRTSIADRIETLKAAKESLPASQYAQDLERLLIELARVSRAIREKQK